MRTQDHYLRFTIKDVFPEQIANRLSETFPSSILIKRLGHGSYANVDLNSDSTEIETFFADNAEWNEYRKIIQSSEFISDCVEIFRQDLLKRYSHFWRLLLGRRAISPKNLFTTMQATVSRRGFKMSPHSDDKYALISLIHYFPEKGSLAKDTGGTRFFVPTSSKPSLSQIRQFTEWGRGLRKFLPFYSAISFEGTVSRHKYGGEINRIEEEKFNKYFVKGEYFTYESNKMIGFVKNAWSFHDVDLTTFPEDENRRALLVNLRLRPTRVSVLFDRIINKLDRVIAHTTNE